MAKIPYTKESARKLWTEARDKYQMTALEDSWLKRQIRYCNDRIEELEV